MEHAEWRKLAAYNLAHALDYSDYAPAVGQLVEQLGRDVVIDGMAAIYLYKHYASPENAERVSVDAAAFSPLMPRPSKPIYRGLKLDPSEPVAQRNVGDTFRLLSLTPLTSWTARKAFAKAWSKTAPTKTQVVLSTTDVQGPVFLAPLDRLEKRSPGLYAILRGMPDSHEDEWLISDDTPLVTVAFVKRARRASR